MFGCKVQRVSIDAGFTCPNRDGSLDTEGCIFCGGSGSGSYGIKRGLDVKGQIEDGKEVMRRKYRAERFLAYFQAYTNTYAPLSELSPLFEEALSVEEIVGLIVATRPDALPDEVLHYFSSLSKTSYFWLEIGVQSIHDRTLGFLNRRHDHKTSVSAIERAVKLGIRVCAHLILGVPGESISDIHETANEMNRLGVHGVKLHLLHVMKGTALEEIFRRGDFAPPERGEYVDMVCDFIERIDKTILIHRVTGDGGGDNLVSPLWSLKKFEVLNHIDSELERRGSEQGVFARSPLPPTFQPL